MKNMFNVNQSKGFEKMVLPVVENQSEAVQFDKRINTIMKLVLKANMTGLNLNFNLTKIGVSVVDCDNEFKNFMINKTEEMYTTIYFADWFNEYYNHAIEMLISELKHSIKMEELK